MMLKAVLCDLDGTLLDSNHFHAEAWQRTFAEFGIEATFEEMVKEIGKGGDHVIPDFVPAEKLPELEQPIKDFRTKLFHREYMDRIVPFSDARRLLERMRQEGLRIAVASSSDKADLQAFLMLLKIHDLVEENTTADDAEQSKPSPDIFEAALKRLEIEPAEAMVLGDTPWDIEAARKAGILSVGVTCGGWAKEELIAAGAVAVYRDPADLLRQFETSVFCG